MKNKELLNTSSRKRIAGLVASVTMVFITIFFIKVSSGKKDIFEVYDLIELAMIAVATVATSYLLFHVLNGAISWGISLASRQKK